MPVHHTRHRVRFHELDPYDHVNHAVYVTYFEVGRVEALESVDLGLDTLKRQGFQMVVTRLELRYRGAAEAAEDLVIDTAIGELRRASATWLQTVRRGGEVLVSAEVDAGITNLEGRPVRPPPEVMERLTGLVDDSRQTAT